MISDECNFNQFVESVKDKEWAELIQLVDQEATNAERMTFKNRTGDNCDNVICYEYASKLKDFILYLRHGVQPSGIKDADLQDFQTRGPYASFFVKEHK